MRVDKGNRPLLLIWTAILLLAVGLMVLYNFASNSLRAEAIDSEGRHNEALAQAIMEHTEGVLANAEALARYLQKEHLKMKSADIAAFVSSSSAAEVGIIHVALTNAAGYIYWSSRGEVSSISLADRPHFTVHVNGSNDATHISEPVIGKVTQTVSVQISRRLTGRDGRFAGTVAVAIDPEFFAAKYSKFPLGKGARITVANRDTSTIIARSVINYPSDIPMRTSFEVGSSFSKSPLFHDAKKKESGHRAGRNVTTGVAAVYGWHQSDRYPLLTTVATDEHAALNGFEKANRQLKLSTTGLILLFVALGLVVSWAINVYRRANATLEMARIAAEESVAFKSEFINGVSHEVRGPLTNINGFAELMATQPLDQETVRDYAVTIQRAGLHLERIVSQLLDAEKAVAGKMVLHLEPVDLVGLLKLAVKIHGAEAARKNIVLDLRFDSEMPQSVMLDSMRFSQVVYNLLNNAIKFTAEGAVMVTARFADGCLTVSVKDTGPGISPRYQKGIFERFRQGDPLLSRIHGGTGIGLSLCKSLVDLMAGRIWLESKVNAGSDFLFEIPLQVCVSEHGSGAAVPVAA